MAHTFTRDLAKPKHDTAYWFKRVSDLAFDRAIELQRSDKPNDGIAARACVEMSILYRTLSEEAAKDE